MLVPKKVKFRKWQTMRTNKKSITPETRGTKLAFGSFGLKSESQARITSNQLESSRKVISRTLTKAGKYWIRVFPDRPYTQKAAQMGATAVVGVDLAPGYDGCWSALPTLPMRVDQTCLPSATFSDLTNSFCRPSLLSR